MRVAEYFAGIGLARLGLEAAGFSVVWSNDLSPKKQLMYMARFGEASHFYLGDVTELSGSTDPQAVDVAWASFPCTDLSIAGARGGLNAGASAAFWGFISSLQRLGSARPEVVALENVLGLATSHRGSDLVAAIKALNDLGYSVDILRIDASRFVPQSRVRLFLVGDRNVVVPKERPDWSATSEGAERHEFRPEALDWVFEHPDLRTHRYPLVTAPAIAHSGLDSVVESIPIDDTAWWGTDRVASFFSSLTPVQAARVNSLRSQDKQTHRTAYRRMRAGVARWEVRGDDLAGCLRTARGGSSRQAIVRLGGGALDVRWMTPSEYAALMGAYGFATERMSASDAQWGFGDAVCVPVVEWLARHAILPRLRGLAHHHRGPSEAAAPTEPVPEAATWVPLALRHVG